MFGRVIKSFDNAYNIGTKYKVLDKNYPIYKLIIFLDIIELYILKPPTKKKITFYIVIVKENTTKKVLMH